MKTPIFNLKQNDSFADLTVIGIYYPNAFFEETQDNAGISYYLDQVIYEKLWAELQNAGLKSVSCKTHMGYSRILISVKPDFALKALQEIEKVLEGLTISCNDLPELSYKGRYPMTAEQRYYLKRTPQSPLSRRISNPKLIQPEKEVLQKLHTKNMEKAFIIITGVVPEKITVSEGQPTGISLPAFSGVPVMLPRSMPWKRSFLQISYEYQGGLEAEAVCQWLRPQLKKAANDLAGRLTAACYFPDYLPEIRFQFSCPVQKEMAIVERVREIIRNVDLEKLDLDALQRCVAAPYQEDSRFPVWWNLEAGELAITGRRPAEQLLCMEIYRKEITPDRLRRVLTAMQSESSIFVTAV